MTIDNKFELGEIVYLMTDIDQFERLITRIVITISKSILYELSCGNQSSLHYAEEITGQKNMLIALGLEQKNNG